MTKDAGRREDSAGRERTIGMKYIKIYFESGEIIRFPKTEKFDMDINGRMTIIHWEEDRKFAAVFYLSRLAGYSVSDEQ